MAGKSLAIAKPQFQQDIYNILYDKKILAK
jgi:hypothetical protein